MLPDCHSCARALIADCSSNLLHAVPIKHDPYTPDSMDSPIPNVPVALGETTDLELKAETLELPDSNFRFSISINRSVSPALLKSKLELIVNKTENLLDSDADFDIRRSPSEHRLYTCSDVEDHQCDKRENRTSSDVSWQRSHLLTRAWVQGKGNHHAYLSFPNAVHQSSTGLKPGNDFGEPACDLIIPRISIIDASNLESNDSSLHHDDRLSIYSDNYLSTYSENRTKTISGNGSFQEKVENSCNKIEEERSNELILTAEKKIENSQFNQTFQIDETMQYRDKLDPKNVSSDKMFYTNMRSYEKMKELKPKMFKKECDSYAIYRNSYNSNVVKENELFGTDIRQETLTSKTATTRTNSTHSQDSNVVAGNVKFKLKNKVTERCKKNIASEKGKCRKCCCVIS